MKGKGTGLPIATEQWQHVRNCNTSKVEPENINKLPPVKKRMESNLPCTTTDTTYTQYSLSGRTKRKAGTYICRKCQRKLTKGIILQLSSEGQILKLTLPKVHHSLSHRQGKQKEADTHRGKVKERDIV